MVTCYIRSPEAHKRASRSDLSTFEHTYGNRSECGFTYDTMKILADTGFDGQCASESAVEWVLKIFWQEIRRKHV